MKPQAKKKDPRAGATARGPKIVALGKSTPVHNANLVRLRSAPANDYRREGDDPAVIFEHTKSGARQIIAQVVEFKGHWSLDIREWLGAPDDRVATKRGISVPLGVMRDLGQAILAASPLDDCGEPSIAG